MTYEPHEIGSIIELHEAEAWSRCVEAAAGLENNPLGAQLDRDFNTPLSTLGAFNFELFNRVIALGVQRPANEADISTLRDFFTTRKQTRYSIEVTPSSQPHDLGELLSRNGFAVNAERIAKCWRSVDNIPVDRRNVEVRELSPDDRNQWIDVNLSAWELPSFFGPWFGATLGCDGFRHFGVFEGERLVSVGAMFSRGDVAWGGFGATRRDCGGRGYQVATLLRRLRAASAMGCQIFHTEIAGITPDRVNRSLSNQLGLGFNRIYDKYTYAPSRESNELR
jgi:hypothetical protein